MARPSTLALRPRLGVNGAGKWAVCRFSEGSMLQMRPNCECCDRDLPADAAGAMICSFECTFCTSCVETVLHGTCPNCGGGFSPRPPRAAELLGKYPPSAERVYKPDGCAKTG